MSLDKKSRLESEREAREKEREPEPLDPAFPYRAVPFDPVFFALTDVRDTPSTSRPSSSTTGT